MKRLILILATLFSFACAADVTVTVNPGGGSDFTTIQAAIDDWDAQTAANDNYIVQLVADITEDVVVDIGAADIDSIIIKGNTSDYTAYPLVTGGILVQGHEIPARIEDLEVTEGALSGSSIIYGVYIANDHGQFANCDVRRVIVRDIVLGSGDSQDAVGIGYGVGQGNIVNCLIYNILGQENGAVGNDSWGVLVSQSTSVVSVINCTVDSVVNRNTINTGTAFGYYFVNNANHELKNNAARGIHHEGGGPERGYRVTAGSPVADWDSCAFEIGTTEPNIGTTIAIDETDYTDVSSFNYIPSSGSALIDAAADIGTRISSHLSIDNIDRDADGLTWDVGSFEVSSPPVVLTGGTSPNAPPILPTATGYGSYATGARGGSNPQIYRVTNTLDSGAGSLRGVVEDINDNSNNEGAYLIFDVAGTIDLDDDVTLTASNVTIYFHTAPGDGINVTQWRFITRNNRNVAIIGGRFMTGEEADSDVPALSGSNILGLCSGTTSDGTGTDIFYVAFNSIYWGVDINFCIRGGGDSVSVEYNWIAEPLDDSVHPNGPHSKAVNMSLNDVSNLDFNKNLVYASRDRSPKWQGDKSTVANNLLVGYGDRASRAQTSTLTVKRVNYINNHLIEGNGTLVNATEFDPQDASVLNNMTVYVAGNLTHNSNPRQGQWDDLTNSFDDSYESPVIHPMADNISLLNASEVRDHVLEWAGAKSYINDNFHDARIKALIEANVEANFVTIDDPSEVGGRQVYDANGEVLTDTDSDGMPDAWEIENGYNPNVDDSINGDIDTYDPIELYAHDRLYSKIPCYSQSEVYKKYNNYYRGQK